MIISDQNTN